LTEKVEKMSDTPKFEVIDRRKYKAEEEEHEAAPTQTPAGAPEPPKPDLPRQETRVGPQLVTDTNRGPVAVENELEAEPELPPAPGADEIRQQKLAYDAAAERLEELVRAQNPGVGPQPAVTFDHLVQQFYVSAMIQMGAGAQEGQRPRVDILGAKQTIELMGILEEKTAGNRTETEERTLQAVLFEVRMAFLELTSMITLQSMQPPQPPPPGKR
jgi:hypothetical protein